MHTPPTAPQTSPDKTLSRTKPLSRRLLQIIFPLLMGIALLWLLYRQMDFNKFVAILRSGVRYEVIAFSLLFGLLGNTFRGVRWHLLIRSLGEHARILDAVLTTHGNYAVNMVLPRMGELWRCIAMSHYSGIRFSKLFGTLLVDRVSDVVCVGVLVLLVALFNFGFFQDFATANPELFQTIHRLLFSWWFLVAVVMAILSLLFALRFFSHLPIVQKGIDAAKNTLMGLKTIHTMERKGLFFLYTVLLWGSYFLYFYTTFYAFDFTSGLGVRIGLIAFLMSSIAIAAPVQAGMGAWHFMVIYTLVFFSVSKEEASSFALIVHAVQTLWTALLGLISLLLLPNLHGKKQLPSD